MQKPVQKAKNKFVSNDFQNVPKPAKVLFMHLRKQVNMQAAEIKELKIEIKELKKNFLCNYSIPGVVVNINNKCKKE